MTLSSLKLALAAATQGRWHYRTCYGVATIEDDKLNPIAHAVDYLTPNNADLITLAVNSLPAILDALAASDRLDKVAFEMWRGLEGHDMGLGFPRDGTPGCYREIVKNYLEASEAYRSARKRLDEVAG